MKRLQQLIEDNENWLLEKIKNYTVKKKYIQHVPPLPVWQFAIAGLSESIILALQTDKCSPDFNVDEDFTEDPATSFIIQETEKHRSRGLKLNYFIGMFKYFRRGYLELVQQTGLEPDNEKKYLSCIERIFDQFEIAICTHWHVPENQLLKDMQITNTILSTQNSRYLTIFESMAYPVMLFGNNNRLTMLNYAARKLLHGESASPFSCHIDCQIIPWLIEKINLFKLKGKSHSCFEHQLETEKGTRYLEIKFTCMLNIAFQYNGILVMLNDITERKQMEKEMARLERLNIVGEMAAGISHEIRNPMTTVRGFLQVLGGKEQFNEYEQYFNLMVDELDKANSIITEYLSLARDKPINLITQNLNTIIEKITPLIKADATEHEMFVEILTGEIPDLLLDKKEIGQLILNLTRNGLESMPSGGTIYISTYTDGNEIVLSVRDEGCGIEPQALEKLGTPFFTTKDKGTGLGLAMCYSIATRHNATIDVESSPTGTNFYIRFLKTNNQATLLP